MKELCQDDNYAWIRRTMKLIFQPVFSKYYSLKNHAPRQFNFIFAAHTIKKKSYALGRLSLRLRMRFLIDILQFFDGIVRVDLRRRQTRMTQ